MKGTSFQSTGLVVIAFPAGMNSIQASGVQDYAGTKGLSKKLEAFSIAPCEIPEVELEYMGHLQDSGDTHWMKAGKLVGIPSSNKRLEGIAVRLKGPAADQYDVKYYVHIQNIGDSVLAANGEFVGTRGKSLSIEGLSVWIEPRVIAPVASSITVRSSGTPLLDVFAYLQGIGPINVYGPHLAGTRGQSRAMEAFQIRMSEYIPGVELEYMAHIQDTGDTQWHKNGQLIGEYRSGKRIEGFAVRLVGEAAEIFNVKYYGHMQDYGDSHVASNGAFVGTRGERRRLEGLCVWLEHK